KLYVPQPCWACSFVMARWISLPGIEAIGNRIGDRSMTSILRRLWHDDRGFILSTELIFLATITVIGVLVGLVIWRDGIVQELGDAGAAIGQFNQSYSIDVQSNSTCGVVVKADSVIITRDFGCVDTLTVFKNFDYFDQDDVCDVDDVDGQPPAGIDVSVAPRNEGQ
ncbi:MAG: hypothetical protein QF516_13410, partial [Pirellulaceae bacterium]|nr:hypothetical protein [Pirellulaceae bacterium]